MQKLDFGTHVQPSLFAKLCFILALLLLAVALPRTPPTASADPAPTTAKPPSQFQYSCQQKVFDIRGVGMRGKTTATISDIPDDAHVTLQLGGTGTNTEGNDSGIKPSTSVTFTHGSDTHHPPLPTRPPGNDNYTDPDDISLAPGPDRGYYRWQNTSGYRVDFPNLTGGTSATVTIEDPDETAQAFVAYSMVPSPGDQRYNGAYATTLGYAWGGNQNTNCSGPISTQLKLDLPNQLPEALDVQVEAVLMDKEPRSTSDQRTVKVWATAGGVSSEIHVIEEPEPGMESLVLVEMTIPAVPAGSDHVLITLESPCSTGSQFPDGGDSVFLLGGATWHPCRSSEEPGELAPIELNADPGYANIELDWNPTSDPTANRYQISRALTSTNPADMQPLTVVSDTTYFDSEGLEAGVSYCYQVAALYPDGSVALKSNVDCATFGTVELWVPDVWAKPGTQAIVPVNIRNADGLPIASSDIWLDFHSDIIEPVAVTNAALTEKYTWEFNVDPYGSSATEVYGGLYKRTIISSIATETPPPPLYGDGSLFWITFNVKGNEGDTSILNLREFIEMEGGSAVYAYQGDEQDPAFVPISLSNGVFHVSNAYILGDLNGDGVVNSSDAYIALQIASGTRKATWEQMNAGDINGDGTINAADTAMILFYAAHQRWPNPDEGDVYMPTMAAAPAADSPITIQLGDVTAEAGGTVEVPLIAQDLYSLGGGDFTIAYDTAVVQSISQASTSDFTSDFAIAYRDHGNGLFQVSLANGEPVGGNGTLATLSVNIAPDATIGSTGDALSLVEANLNDIHGRDFSTSSLQQPLARSDGTLVIEASDHTVYLPTIQR